MGEIDHDDSWITEDIAREEEAEIQQLIQIAKFLADTRRAVDVCWEKKEESDFHYSVLMFYIKNDYLTPKQVDAVLQRGAYDPERLRLRVMDFLEEHGYDDFSGDFGW